MKKRNFIIIISLVVFICLVVGISYSYFVYNKSVADVTLNTGNISIDTANVNGNLSVSNALPMDDNMGKINSNYIDFTVNASVDTEYIYYEIYLLPKESSTLDTSHLKTYLTSQTNVLIKDVTLYSLLPNYERQTGKIIYQEIINTNNDGSPKTYTKDFRLRLWLDPTYSNTTAKTFDFDIYLYAKNVSDDFVIP